MGSTGEMVALQKVHALVCSADSVARPLLQNKKQFNGIKVVTSVTIEVEAHIPM